LLLLLGVLSEQLLEGHRGVLLVLVGQPHLHLLSFVSQQL
jgi:hypothetical protein